MRLRTSFRKGCAAGIISILAAVIVCGCFNPFDPTIRGVGVTEPSPVPDSPENVLHLLEWCYRNRAIFEYRELFDNDYRFVFGARDPDGNAYRDNPWTREDEVESTTHLFQGGDANQPAASSIAIFLDKNFNVAADPQRPGAGHKLIRTAVSLRIVTPDQQREVTGFANFFLVRGDSAAIPQELRERGFKPDPNRWYILRHEDDTFQDEQGAAASAAVAPAIEGHRAAPTTGVLSIGSWGSLKRAYR